MVNTPTAPSASILFLTALFAACLCGESGAQSNDSPAADAPAGKVLATVNGEPITESDLEFLYLSRRIPENVRASVRSQFIEQLIDRRLMQAFLDKRKASADEAEVQALVERIHAAIRRGGDDPQQVLARLGFDEARLRQELALPLAWQVHVNRIVTPQQMRAYWQKHRHELDGTEVRASQILIKLPAEADAAQVQQAEEQLAALREDIVAGRIAFAEAARRHSDAPSKDAGGDLGFFPYRGRMPVVFSKAAIPLEPGEVSRPFRSQFGLHLLTVTDRRPGQLSLEDVRPLVLEALAREVWDELVKQQRSQAQIVRIEADQQSAGNSP